MPEPSEFRPRVLVVDRELPETRKLIEALQTRGGMTPVWARDGEAALHILEEPGEPLHGMVCEARAQRVDGLRLLREALKRHPDLCAVLIAGKADLESATAAVRAGAADVLPKPVDLDKLLSVLRQGLSRQELREEVHRLQEQLSDRFGFERLVGRSRALLELIARLRQVAPTEAPVLLEGESGTGKTLITQAVHRNSSRHAEAFVTVHCAGVAEPVLEEDLFGRPAGRGTPARPGSVETAARGTLHLDEAGDLPPRLQTQLLRLMSEGAYERPGGLGAAEARPRLIATTSRDLADLVRRGKFRDDLYYLLAGARLEVPPLRARREDIPLLTHALIEETNHAHGRMVTGATRGFMDSLLQHSWPGNVRELKSVLEGVVLFTEGRRALEAGDLPEYLRDRPPVPQDFRIRVGMSMAEIERRAIQETLQSCGGDKARAARVLGIGLRTLYRKIKEYELA